MLEINKVYWGDCLGIMKDIDDKSIDMILCDLPYGTTACKWDVIIPFEKLWQSYKRIIKDTAPMIFTAREPFTSMLVMSNITMYKHKWIWNKKQSGSFQNAKYMPLQIEEDIVVFSKNKTNYLSGRRTWYFLKTGAGLLSPEFKLVQREYAMKPPSYRFVISCK